MSQTKTRGKFRSADPIVHRPEERIATQTAERRAVRAAARGRRLRRPGPMIGGILFVALIGLGIAVYTTIVHYVGFSALVCGGGDSCLDVQSSVWNNVAGVPVSVLGLVGYSVILGSLLIRGAWAEYGRAIGFLTALIGFLFSLYLTYREAFSIHHYCEWCLGSAACMTLLTILTGIRFLRAQPGS